MTLVNPADSLERQNEKLVLIAQALMRRVEQKNDQSGLAYQQFERAALLEARVKERTEELERALDLLQESNAGLERANVEIATGRANLNEAIESINEGFALFDTRGHLIQFNSRFCRWFEDISGHLHEGLTFDEYVHLVSRSRYLELPEGQSPSAWAERRIGVHTNSHVVLNVRLTSNKWLQVSEHRTDRGATVILQTDVSDIMRRERLERDKMRDEQAKTLQATLDHLNQGICIFDSDLRLAGWNQNMDGLLALPVNRTVHGLPFTEIVQFLGRELTFHDNFDLEKLQAWSRRQTRKPITFEVTRNGIQRLRVFAQEMPDRGFVISFTDVTVEHEAAAALAEMNERLEKGVRDRTIELGQALKEAERANASKSRFVAAASHDLLQPLSAAKLFLSSIADKLTDAEGHSTLMRAESALLSVEHIIEALLDISRLDAGQAVFRVQPVKLSMILGPLRDELTPVAQAKGLSLAIDEEDLTVRSDPGYLRRILQNLIANAVKYTDVGDVQVSLVRQGTDVSISVADTGPGIPAADQGRIFQEFERCETDEKTPGLGLGLAIVERACAGLGHALDLQSQTGRGSIFSITVALAQDHQAEVQQHRPNVSLESLSGVVFLLVENDRALMSAMTQFLERLGGDVLQAVSAEEAIRLLEELELVPDFLILDYQLGPGATGLALWSDLQHRHGRVPGVILSAERTEDLRQRCDDAGVPLMKKPVDKDALVDRITRLLSRC